MSSMDQPTRPFERNAGNLVAFLISLVAHVSLFLLLACWVYSAGASSRGLLLRASAASQPRTIAECRAG